MGGSALETGLGNGGQRDAAAAGSGRPVRAGGSSSGWMKAHCAPMKSGGPANRLCPASMPSMPDSSSDHDECPATKCRCSTQ